MDWRPSASKMVVLIADAPPHGIGEYGDGVCLRVVANFLQGDLHCAQASTTARPMAMIPCGLHGIWPAAGLFSCVSPLRIFTSADISRAQFFVACEPALSGYSVSVNDLAARHSR